MKVRGYIQNGHPNIFSKLFRLNLIEGWSNRLGNVEMVEKQAETIRQIFTFRKDIVDIVDAELSKQDAELLIGIHIRRGDYKEWLNGSFYYTDEVYLKVIEDIEKQLKDNGKAVKFLLCSNEEINMDNFKEYSCFTIPQSSGAKDLYALSKCDYIVGPPSSYSQWASFYGKTPLKFIMDSSERIKLHQFSTITALSKFENGDILNID
ncbi:MAG: alpha-1,2-fucosyltransferase [Dysgonomonas sp.]|nr:alpha-1,2-fucosyltransferase [Dysgonomonas sp.]